MKRNFSLKKKVLSIALCLMLVLGCMPAAVIAQAAENHEVADATALKNAIDTAAAGDTITVTGSITVSEPIVIGTSITLQGSTNGMILYTGSDRAVDIPASTTEKVSVTVKDLTIVAPNAQRGINYNDDGTLTLDNVFVAGDQDDNQDNPLTYALNLPTMSDGATVNINNSYFVGHIALNVWGENVSVTATHSHFISVDHSTAENYNAVVLNNDGVDAAEGSVLNFIGCSITATDENSKFGVAVSDATKTGVIDIDDDTVVNGGILAVVATVRYDNGNSYSFYDLQAAIDKAIADGMAVDMHADVGVSEIITITGAVTINGNGYTLTSSASRAVNVDTTEVVIINDLTIVGTTGCERGINIINQAGHTELNNVTISGQSHYAVHIATSAGAAQVSIWGGSDLTGYAAVAVYGDEARVYVTDSNLVGVNTWEDNGSNDFATIAVGAKDVVVSVMGDSTVTAESSDGLAHQMIIGASSGNCEGLLVALDAELVTKGTATIIGLDPSECEDVIVRPDYADALLAEGFATAVVSDDTEMNGYLRIDTTKQVFTVTFVIDGETVATKNVVEGENVNGIPMLPEKEGYTASWDHDGKNITADTTISAVYTEKTYTVTYVVDGETYKTETYPHGASITLAAVPNKEGYTGTWDKEVGVITGNVTITAVYTENSHVTPDDPDTGDDVTTPDNPDAGDNDTMPSTPDSPQTGDKSNLVLWFVLFFVSGLGLVGTFLFRKAKNATAR